MNHKREKMRILCRKPKGIGPLGRPKLRIKSNITADLRVQTGFIWLWTGTGSF